MKRALMLLAVLVLVIAVVPAAFAADLGWSITVQPVDVAGAVGTNGLFSVDTDLEDATFQWQFQNATSTKWNNCSATTPGYNTNTVSVSITAARDGYKYRCVVTDAEGNSQTSDYATLTVREGYGITINGQPVDVTTPVNTQAVFSVAALCGPDEENPLPLTYQWQFSGNGGRKWNNSTSATTGYNTNEIVVSSQTSRDGYMYRCIITNEYGDTVVSKVATLTVGTPPVSILAHPESVLAEDGTTVDFVVTAEGEGLTYQWEYTYNYGAKWFESTSATEGYNTNRITLRALERRNNYQYRCVITNANGETVRSKVATMKVGTPVINITKQPESVAVPMGGTAVFTVEAEGEGLTYQWEYSRNLGRDWANSSSATQGYNTNQLFVKLNTQRINYVYRCIITNAEGQVVKSRLVALMQGDGTPTAINTQPTAQTVIEGENAEFSVVAVGDELTYQWQTKVDGEWTDIADATEATLTFVAGLDDNGTEYQCVVTDKYGYSLTTDAVSLTVDALVPGTAKNPEPVEDISFMYLGQEAGDADGYYYVWEAPAAGIVSFTGMAYDADYNNIDAYDVIVNGNKLSETDGVLDVAVAAGEAVVIQLIGNDAAEASVYAYGSFANGTADYPFALDPDNIPGTATTKEIAAGAAQVYTTSAGNVNMVINAANISVVYKDKTYTPVDGVVFIYLEQAGFNPITRQPEPNALTITNTGAEAAVFTASFTYPAGHSENPAELQIGDNTAVVAAGTEGYYYTWIAEEDGTLTVTMPEGNWFYVINNLTAGAYGDWQYSDSDPVVGVAVLEVTAGDEISLNVNTYDPASPWSAPAGNIVVNVKFAAASDVEINEDLPALPEDGVEN